MGAWSGIAWVVICGGGFGASGLLLVLVGGLTFLITWSLTLAYQIRKCANPSTIAFCVLTLVGLTGGIIGMMCSVLGSAMAFRVETMSPNVTQLLYDLIWFLFLIPWPPFMLWQFVTAFAILSHTNQQEMFPRWLGYFSLWAGALEVFSALSVFYYHGPFSYNGLVTFWVPGVSFFVWVLVLAIMQIRRLPRARAAESQVHNEVRVDAHHEIDSVRTPSAARM